MATDGTQEIHRDGYSEVLHLLKKDWPQSIHIYYFIKNYINWSAKIDTVDMKLYCCNEGEQDWAVLVMVHSETGFYNRMAMVYAGESGLEKLKGLLKNPKIINWDEYIHIQAVHEKHISLVDEFVEQSNNEITKTAYCQLWLPPAKSKTIQLDGLSSELELRDLKEHHSEIINRAWEYRASGSDKFIRDTVVHNGGVGLFLKGSDELIAWNLVQFYFGLGMLQTLEVHRRKGYGSLVTKALSKKLADQRVDPFACIKYDNLKSLTMFKDLGFEEICNVYLYDTINC